LSPTTADEDRDGKKQLYQNTFCTPEYFWFDPKSLEFEGFRLINSQYVAIAPNPNGWRWSDTLQLFLGVREGMLRYFTPNGDLVPTPQEAKQVAERQTEQVRLQAERERQRADRLAERLRALGINPDEI